MGVEVLWGEVAGAGVLAVAVALVGLGVSTALVGGVWFTGRADAVIAEWAAAAGYDLIAVGSGGAARKRAEVLKFGHWDRPGVVRRVTVETPEGVVRDAWVFVAGGPVVAFAGARADLSAEFIDVAWDD